MYTVHRRRTCIWSWREPGGVLHACRLYVHVRALARIYAAAAQALAGPEPDLVKAYPPYTTCMHAGSRQFTCTRDTPTKVFTSHACVRAFF